MDVDFIVGVFECIPCLKGTGLVVSAVRAGDKFSEGVIAREPSFQIVFHRCSIVKLSRNNINDLIVEAKSLVELLRSSNHSLEFVPGLVRFAENELLNLFKLMHSKDSPDISARRTSLLSETGGDTSISLGEIRRLYPFLIMHGRDRLLRSCDQVKRLVVVSTLNLIQVFGEVGKLACLFHDTLLHEIGRLHLCIFIFVQFVQSVVDESLVEHDSEALEVVAAMTCNTGASFHFKDV